MKFNRDFYMGYSPERVNPGDREHTIPKIKKIVSGSTPEVLEQVAAVYGKVVKAGIHRAPNIRTAEAAKVIENIQRDVNIGLINELAVLFDRMGLDIHEVLGRRTKWNFLAFKPGLVGGHCIGVDPFYMAYKAEEVGYHPEIILAGRRVNDSMGVYVANRATRSIMRRAGNGHPVVTVLGVTFKEQTSLSSRQRRPSTSRASSRISHITVQLARPRGPTATSCGRKYQLCPSTLLDAAQPGRCRRARRGARSAIATGGWRRLPDVLQAGRWPSPTCQHSSTANERHRASRVPPSVRDLHLDIVTPTRSTSAASAHPCSPAARPAVSPPSAPLVAPRNTLASTLALARVAGREGHEIGVPGFTLMVCVPSLCFSVRVWPSGAAATVATVALVIMLSGFTSEGQWPSP